jgi:hypothetical protein
MKKIVSIAAFFATCYFTAAAQNADLRMGFQLSPTFSILTTDENAVNSNGTNLGLKMGARSEIYFRENYAFLVGLGFAFNGGGTLRLENSSDTWQDSELPAGVPRPQFPGTELKYSLQYVEIPFGIKLKTREYGYLRYFVESPVITLGFRSQARGSIEYTGLKEENIDIKREVSAMALSWGLSGGIEYGVSGNTALVAGLGFQRLFTDLSKDYSPDVNYLTNMTSIILHLGVMF